jgi:hypothetical protein
MPQKKEYLLDEWKILREEIARKQAFNERLTITQVAGNLAIYSFSLSSSSGFFGMPPMASLRPVIALLPVVLSTLVFYWILKENYSVLRIVWYIKKYIEPKTGLKWETSLQELRGSVGGEQKQGISRKNPKLSKYAPIYSPIYNTFHYLSCLLAITLLIASNTSLPNLIGWGASIIISVFIWRLITHRAWINEKLKQIHDLSIKMQDNEH